MIFPKFPSATNIIIKTNYVLGQKYAMMEMKTVLSNLLRRFHFSSLEVPTQPLMIPSTVIVLKPKDGINLIIKKRA